MTLAVVSNKNREWSRSGASAVGRRMCNARQLRGPEKNRGWGGKEPSPQPQVEVKVTSLPVRAPSFVCDVLLCLLGASCLCCHLSLILPST